MKRTCRKVLCLLILAASPLSPMAIAHNSRPADFFTTPDTKASGAPEFAGRPQSDSWANGLQNNDGDMPRIDLISAMPSVSGDQRKQLNDLYQTTRKQMQPYYDEITALQKRLKAIRAEKSEVASAPPAVAASAAKNTTTVAQKSAATTKTVLQPTVATTTKKAGANPSNAVGKTADRSDTAVPAVDLSYIDSLQTEDQVNTKVNDAKKKIRDSADLLRDRMFALLTDQQKEEMIAMRHGTLIIDSDARTDVPPPAPPAEKGPAKPAAPPKSPTATASPATAHDSTKPVTPHDSTKPATPQESAKPGASSVHPNAQNKAYDQVKERESTEQPLMQR